MMCKFSRSNTESKISDNVLSDKEWDWILRVIRETRNIRGTDLQMALTTIPKIQGVISKKEEN